MICVLFKYSRGISCSKEWRYSIPFAISNANFIPCSWSTMIPTEKCLQLCTFKRISFSQKTDKHYLQLQYINANRYYMIVTNPVDIVLWAELSFDESIQWIYMWFTVCLKHCLLSTNLFLRVIHCKESQMADTETELSRFGSHLLHQSLVRHWDVKIFWK